MRHFALVIFASSVAVSTLLVWLLYHEGFFQEMLFREDRLFPAVWNNDSNKVASLLKTGADPNVRSIMLTRTTPLIDAVRFGNLDVVQLLLNEGADPNKADRWEHAALYYALTSPELGGTNDFVSEKIISNLFAYGASLTGKGVIDAITNLPPNDPRCQICQNALTSFHIKGSGRE